MEIDLKLTKRELFQPSHIEIREGSEGEQIIEGDAIMCDAETILYEDDEVREIESIDPSCITKEFVEAQEMFINAQHDRGKTFGKQGAKLEVIVKEDRVSCRCKGTSAIFAETRALINDGVYTGMSFEFWPKDYTVTKREGADGKMEYLIRHTSFKAIGALTVAMQPAYKQTSIAAREYEELTRAEAELLKRQKEEEEAKHQQAREEEEAEARKREAIEQEDRARRIRFEQYSLAATD